VGSSGCEYFMPNVDAVGGEDAVRRRRNKVNDDTRYAPLPSSPNRSLRPLKLVQKQKF
jgi:hypothetical protein